MHPAEALAQQLKPGQGWGERLADEFRQPYMQKLAEFLAAEEQAGKVLYPPSSHCFNALNSTPLDQVSVVILGQDPYHGPGQAHGLCFSVRPQVPPPPSLVNIFKEIETDLNIAPPDHGCLQPWAEQGVLLLNSVLTVEQSSAGAHQGKGWETFTDKVIEVINRERHNVVFLLWGSYARKKGQRIDRNRHLVLEGPHPSPLSAYRGFFGCRHFSKANEWLQQQGRAPVNWALPDKAELLARYQK
ncbi:uracil-DNA glycosylase [Marinobacter daepoensis]|uniref:Uracil-DNA glycosylase n=1 Tax=Marinobacter daepoensis TaxID=262077 RepID=A0ABS3BHY4_9GAMM|nr:uracil-DNA glycosylase [Marinobacter daepoensis]MBN7771436.1 uracil-DNA glycosylase [Marinobacter daepoensis]MBY6034293.1 uracil-DNA glycosylase [Marinobacter daepoensis]MBY6080037.1 uracil-DNA glycosylase [Marinobacter daepoensis]